MFPGPGSVSVRGQRKPPPAKAPPGHSPYLARASSARARLRKYTSNLPLLVIWALLFDQLLVITEMRPREESEEERGQYGESLDHMHAPTIVVALSGTERPESPALGASAVVTSHLFPRYPTPSPPSKKKRASAPPAMQHQHQQRSTSSSAGSIPSGGSFPGEEVVVSTSRQLDMGTAAVSGQELQQRAEMASAVSFGSLSSGNGYGNGHGWRQAHKQSVSACDSWICADRLLVITDHLQSRQAVGCRIPRWVAARCSSGHGPAPLCTGPSTSDHEPRGQ